jgi:hypothetical protein
MTTHITIITPSSLITIILITLTIIITSSPSIPNTPSPSISPPISASRTHHHHLTIVITLNININTHITIITPSLPPHVSYSRHTSPHIPPSPSMSPSSTFPPHYADWKRGSNSWAHYAEWCNPGSCTSLPHYADWGREQHLGPICRLPPPRGIHLPSPMCRLVKGAAAGPSMQTGATQDHSPPFPNMQTGKGSNCWAQFADLCNP